MVQTLASPINPADINTVQGVYAVKPPLPAVGGSEAVGKVISLGPDVKTLSVGDTVLTRQTGLGTWCTHLVSAAKAFFKLPLGVPLESAATLSVNPCTAYRMLVDFVKLSPGDVVIQTGSNSAVGQAVIQVAKAMGVQTINLVRNRPDFDQLKSKLTDLGADWVVREEDLKTLKLPKAKLGFNCVAGKSGIAMMKNMEHGSNLVIYGGMSRQPLSVPVSFLIFNDIRVRGFWMTGWKAKKDDPKVADDGDFAKMMDYLCKLAVEGKLKAPSHRFISLDEFKEGMNAAMPAGGMGGEKIIFKF